MLDQVEIAFDDQRAVASAGLLLPATLAERLGIEQVTDQVVEFHPPSTQRATAHFIGGRNTRCSASSKPGRVHLRPPNRPILGCNQSALDPGMRTRPPEMHGLICPDLISTLISIGRQPVLIAATRCYLIQML